MESYVLDWANLLLRWVHVITAIAWIGSSFYFVFLDSSLTPPEDEDLKKQGVSGELWAVHGGGFYHPVKFNVSPPQLPKHLHWFFWESYSTWLSGFALFTVSYLYSASTYLIDKSKMDWAPATAIIVALAFFVVFWLLYDAICRIFGQRKNGDAIVGALVFVLVCVASWLACHWFAGRAAFLLVGAMIATAMSANVFFWIIPGQRTVVAQIKAGQPVDPIHGKRGKQRSVHNTYFTLPVLFIMISNHYPMTYSHPNSWLVLIVMMLAGVLIRQFFVLRHRGQVKWWLPAAGVALLALLIVLMAPQARRRRYRQGGLQRRRTDCREALRHLPRGRPDPARFRPASQGRRVANPHANGPARRQDGRNGGQRLHAPRQPYRHHRRRAHTDRHLAGARCAARPLIARIRPT